MRRALASVEENSGFVGNATPVFGSMRIIEPSSVVGSEGLRRSWLRRAPPSFVGSPNGFPGLFGATG